MSGIDWIVEGEGGPKDVALLSTFLRLLYVRGLESFTLSLSLSRARANGYGSAAGPFLSARSVVGAPVFFPFVCALFLLYEFYCFNKLLSLEIFFITLGYFDT